VRSGSFDLGNLHAGMRREGISGCRFTPESDASHDDVAPIASRNRVPQDSSSRHQRHVWAGQAPWGVPGPDTPGEWPPGILHSGNRGRTVSGLPKTTINNNSVGSALRSGPRGLVQILQRARLASRLAQGDASQPGRIAFPGRIPLAGCSARGLVDEARLLREVVNLRSQCEL
jgi:hypothetical protein